MGYSTGRAGPLSAGANTLVTNLTGAPTGARIIVGGKSSGDTDNHISIGTMDGTHQNVQYTWGGGSSTSNSNVIVIKDNAGTVQLQAAWTSFGTSGGSGTVVLNVTTNNINFLPTIEAWN